MFPRHCQEHARTHPNFPKSSHILGFNVEKISFYLVSSKEQEICLFCLLQIHEFSTSVRLIKEGNKLLCTHPVKEKEKQREEEEKRKRNSVDQKRKEKRERPTFPPFSKIEQEQTMFDDLRRGFTEDFQGLTEFERTFKDRPKKHQNLSDFAFLAVLTFKRTLKVKFDLIRPT